MGFLCSAFGNWNKKIVSGCDFFTGFMISMAIGLAASVLGYGLQKAVFRCMEDLYLLVHSPTLSSTSNL